MELPSFISQNLDTILVIATIIASFLVIKLVTKILFRLIIVLTIMILALVGYQTFSNTNIIDDVTNLYCKENKANQTKCSCFVQPIIADLETRFSKEELEKLKNKKLKINTEFIKSYKIKEQYIRSCFENAGDSSGILEEIFNDIKKAGLKVLQ